MFLILLTDSDCSIFQKQHNGGEGTWGVTASRLQYPESGTGLPQNSFKHLVVRGPVGICLEDVCHTPTLCPFSPAPVVGCSCLRLETVHQSKGLVHSSSHYIIALKVKWGIGVGGSNIRWSLAVVAVWYVSCSDEVLNASALSIIGWGGWMADPSFA